MTALHVAGMLGAHFAKCSTHCIYRWPVINTITVCKWMWWCQSDIFLLHHVVSCSKWKKMRKLKEMLVV